MRLLYFIKGLGLGGAERHVVECAKALAAQGHDIRVAYVLDYKDALVPELDADGVQVSCIGGGRLWPLRMLVGYFNICRRFRPEVVHSHLPVPGIVSRVFKKLFGYRLVFTEHNVFDRLHPLTRRAHAATRWLDDAAVSCSKAVAQSLPWSSKVIDNGITVLAEQAKSDDARALRGTLGIADDALVFMCIANLLPKKNHALLIAAFDRALKQSAEADWHVVLVGQDATERARLEQLCREQGVEGRVHFYGAHPRASELLPSADVFCLPSIQEGLPISLLEAMSAGLPCLVTDVGGMPDVIEQGVSGLVVASGDEDGYADAVLRMGRHPALRQQMGRAALARVKANYSQEAMLEALLAIYQGAPAGE
ncbi:MAG: glycosyltransferase [Salinisphaeraceae bacterium]|nr:glycosyltransferase [Salinisphaeraceae bacterium]